MSITDLQHPPLTADDTASSTIAGSRSFALLVLAGSAMSAVLGTCSTEPVASDYDDDEDEDYFYDDDDDEQDDLDDDFDDDEEEDDEEEDDEDDEI